MPIKCHCFLFSCSPYETNTLKYHPLAQRKVRLLNDPCHSELWVVACNHCTTRRVAENMDMRDPINAYKAFATLPVNVRDQPGTGRVSSNVRTDIDFVHGLLFPLQLRPRLESSCFSSLALTVVDFVVVASACVRRGRAKSERVLPWRQDINAACST